MAFGEKLLEYISTRLEEAKEWEKQQLEQHSGNKERQERTCQARLQAKDDRWKHDERITENQLRTREFTAAARPPRDTGEVTKVTR